MKEVVKHKVEDRVLLSTKVLVFQIKKQIIKKLTEKFVGFYKIKEIISKKCSVFGVTRINEYLSDGKNKQSNNISREGFY